MIPAIGTMIAAYIGFRMIEVFLTNSDRYSSKGAKNGAAVLAAIVLVVTAISFLGLMASGIATTPGFPALR